VHVYTVPVDSIQTLNSVKYYHFSEFSFYVLNFVVLFRFFYCRFFKISFSITVDISAPDRAGYLALVSGCCVAPAALISRGLPARQRAVAQAALRTSGAPGEQWPCKMLHQRRQADSWRLRMD